MATVYFEPCRRGDTYGPHRYTVELTSGTLASCEEITFTIRKRATKSSPVLLQITMTGGRITVVSATVIEFGLLPDETFDLEAARLKADIEVLLPGGVVKTLAMAQDFEVTPDVT
jgi:hypothetical protein